MGAWRDNLKTFISDIVSKKFVVFLVATSLLWTGKITPDIWMYIALGYMSMNFLENISSVLRK